MNRISKRICRWLALGLTAGVAALGWGAAGASQKTQGDERARIESKDGAAAAETESQPRDVMVHLGGLRIAVDPKTGELRPLTKQESAKLASEMRRRFKPRDIGEPARRPDGSMSAIVAPNVLRFSTARIAEDGSVKVDCAESKDKAIELLTSPVEKTSPVHREEK